MLVEQAAAAFEIWRNLDSTVHLDIDGAMALVRQQMN
jgi:shikimate 5-dehydrogenase